jgi:hypothetical protein
MMQVRRGGMTQQDQGIASLLRSVKENEEVVPVNVSTWVLPSVATAGR